MDLFEARFLLFTEGRRKCDLIEGSDKVGQTMESAVAPHERGAG
jgi:hypothetical protein